MRYDNVIRKDYWWIPANRRLHRFAYADIFKLKTCYFFPVPTGTGNIQPRRGRGGIFIKPQWRCLFIGNAIILILGLDYGNITCILNTVIFFCCCCCFFLLFSCKIYWSVNFHPQDQEQSTPLHVASYLGDVHIMELILASGRETISEYHILST